MKRRESLKLMAVASLAAAFPGCTLEEVEKAASRVSNGSGTPEFENRTPSILTEHEFGTVHKLVDYIIPADDRSGSATDAEVPTFIDFVLEEVQDLQTPMKEGLSWLDERCGELYSGDFLSISAESQVLMLDAIAYPEDYLPENEAGVEFFNTLRDLTASGFWSSKLGVEDLGYSGNTPRAVWDGCSHDAMEHLGLTYD